VQEEVQPESGERRKLGARLFHGCDYNAFGNKAVALQSLFGLKRLKRFWFLGTFIGVEGKMTKLPNFPNSCGGQ